MRSFASRLRRCLAFFAIRFATDSAPAHRFVRREIEHEQPALERAVEQHVALARAKAERVPELVVERDDRRAPAGELALEPRSERCVQRRQFAALADALAVRRIADDEPTARFGRTMQVPDILARELDEPASPAACALRLASLSTPGSAS
jgi:hypothetical protein